MEMQFVDKWRSQVKKGVLEFIILIQLSSKELYGYEILDELKKTMGYEVAEGTIYPLLNRLKADDLIDSYWMEMESGVPRKYYKMTKTGNKVLAEMKKYWFDLNSNINKLSK